MQTRLKMILIGVVAPFAMAIILIAVPIYCGVWMYHDLVDQQPSWDFWVFPPLTMAGMTLVAWFLAGLLIMLGWSSLQCEIHHYDPRIG